MKKRVKLIPVITSGDYNGSYSTPKTKRMEINIVKKHYDEGFYSRNEIKIDFDVYVKELLNEKI